MARETEPMASVDAATMGPKPSRMDLGETLRRLALTASHSLKFKVVTVSVCEADGRIRVTADTGDRSILGNIIDPDYYDDLRNERYKVSNSYLIPPEYTLHLMRKHGGNWRVPEMLSARAPDEWDPLNMLIVPFVDSHGELIGHFSVDCPQDGRLPSIEVISDLETFAHHAALTVENARLFERLEAEAEAVRRSEERFRSLVQNASDVIWVIDAEGEIRYLSPSVERVLGYTPDELVGASGYALVHPDDAGRIRTMLRYSLRRGGNPRTTELRLLHHDGSWRTTEVVTNNLLRDPNVQGVVLNSRDITERTALQAQLVHRAYHDPLTGLPNRALFLERLDHALQCPGDERARAGAVSVLFLDLDGFKHINDSLGHGIGDSTLVAAAGRLRGCLRPGDTVARLGGDEFAVLLEGRSEDGGDREDAAEVAGRIAERLNPAFEVGGHEIYITTSIGIATGATGVSTPADLVRDADIAMYRAKSAGKARHEVFDPSMGFRALERASLEADLRRAVDREEFAVLYQPKVLLATGGIVGAEALVRWRHPQRGIVPPLEFIPLAEETGLILPIGHRVLEEACRVGREWRERYPGHRQVVMSVNLSARQFQRTELAAEIARALAASGLDPHTLQLEITESVVMEDAEATIRTLRDLKELGVQLAIDDFGTGYSSLSYLKRFPVDMLKIDKSFVAGLRRNPEDTAIVRAVITLAHSLGIRVTAEGVESALQLEQLRELGCEIGQGYLFAKPLPEGEMDALLRDDSRAPTLRLVAGA